MAEVGRDAEADELSAQALIDIRAQTARGKTDIAAWSRESFAMLVRVSVLQSEGGWAETQAARERFDMRQDQLAARGCPGKRDYFDLIDRLTQAPPPIRSVKESARQFDLGSTRTTHHLNGIDPRLDRLLAYQALRFQEETGLPVRLGNLGLSFPILTEAARWLMDIAPARAIDALLRASPGLTGKQFDSLLTRTTVARVGDAEAERLIPRLAALVASIRARISLDSPMVSYWKDRLKATLEIASRLILRAPNRAAEWLEIALSLQSDPLFSRRYELGTELQNLVNRAFEAARWADREDMLLKLFSSDIQPGAGAFANDSLDLAAGFSVDVLAFKPNPRWAAIIQATIDALRDGSRRKAASARLHWLLRCDLLDQAELLRAGEALWQSDFCEAGLPSGTIFWPASFLSLPHPKGVDPSAAFTARFLDGTPLTDAVVRDGNLAHAYQSSAFKLSEEQLIGEIERLRDFVADHPEAQPDPLDRGPTQLVDQTSRMAAALAKRAKAVPSAVSALSELTDSDRYPLRPEPAMAALVNVKILEAPTAELAPEMT